MKDFHSIPVNLLANKTAQMDICAVLFVVETEGIEPSSNDKANEPSTSVV